MRQRELGEGLAALQAAEARQRKMGAELLVFSPGSIQRARSGDAARDAGLASKLLLSRPFLPLSAVLDRIDQDLAEDAEEAEERTELDDSGTTACLSASSAVESKAPDSADASSAQMAAK